MKNKRKIKIQKSREQLIRERNKAMIDVLALSLKNTALRMELTMVRAQKQMDFASGGENVIIKRSTFNDSTPITQV